MKPQSVILVIVLVVLSSINAFEFTNLQEVQALKTTKYATNLIETLNLSLQNSGSIDEIKKLLEEILTQLDQDQVKADIAWRAEDARLAKLIKELEEAIKELATEIAQLKKEIAELERKIKESKANLDQFNLQRGENDKSIEKTKKKREQDKENFKRSQSEHTDVANALDQVIEKLSELIGSVAGVGKFEHIEATEAELRDMKTQFLQIANNNEEEASILMELATSANQDALKKLIDLLKRIKESIKKSSADDVEAEAQSEAASQDLIANLEADNEKLDEAIVHQTENLRKYEGQLADRTVRLKRKQEEFNLKKEQKKNTEKQREETEVSYKNEKAERAADKTTVNKLRKIFLEKIANMSKILRTRAAGF